MTPFKCRVLHNPPKSWGDCLRVSVASLLDIDPPEQVPHFFDNDVSGEDGMRALSKYLATQGLTPFWIHVDPQVSFKQLMAHMRDSNSDIYYLLFCRTAKTESHVVICCGGTVVHDSAWIESDVVGPIENNNWIICTFVPLRMVNPR